MARAVRDVGKLRPIDDLMFSGDGAEQGLLRGVLDTSVIIDGRIYEII